MKKIRNIIIVISCILLFGFGFINIKNKKDSLPSIKFAQTGESGFEIQNVELLADTNGLPKEGKVYKIKKPNISDNDIVEKAQKFGISGSVRNDGMGKTIEDKDKLIHMFNTGGYTYINKLNIKPNFDSKVNLDDKIIKEKTDKFLIENGLLEKDFQFSDVSTSKRYKSDGTSEDGTNSVFYYRKIDGIEVGGVSRIIVNYAINGEIQSVVGAYRDIDGVVDTYPLKATNKAIDDLKAHKGTIFSKNLEKGKLKIKKVELIYWEEPNYNKQPYIQPVYKFSGDAIDGSVKDDFTALVSAIDENYIK